MFVWFNGIVVRALDSQSIGCQYNSWPLSSAILTSCSHPSSINWYQ